jgi:Tfp pilus assembly protein PilF
MGTVGMALSSAPSSPGLRRAGRTVVSALLVLVVLSAMSAWAGDKSKPGWQWVTLPKPGLPRFLTKPAKVQTELPPKEAAQACLATAKDLLDQGYDHEAIQLFERARTLDPKRTEVSRYLAVLYDRQDDAVRATAEYELALKLTPKDADLLNDIGYFHYHRSQWPAAEQRFREALALNPKLERAKINLGMTLAQQGHYQQAYAAFAEAVGPAAAHSNVGVLLARQGRHAEAIAAFQNSIDLEPGSPQARACLACLTRPAAPVDQPDGTAINVGARPGPSSSTRR